MLKRISKISINYRFSYFIPKKNYIDIPVMSPSDSELGNLPDIGKNGSLHKFIVNNHNKLGDIFIFYWFKQKVVSLGHPKYFENISKLKDRPPELFKLFQPLVAENSLQFANGEDYIYRKNTYVTPGFSQSQLRDSYFNIIKETTHIYLKKWENYSKDGCKVQLQKECLSMALRIISKGIFGEISDDEIQGILYNYDKAITEIETRIGGNFPEPGSIREKDFKNNIGFFRELCRKNLNIKKEKNTALIDYLKNEDFEKIVSESLLFLIGGFHTTGNAIFWTLYYLTINPDILNKLRIELDRELIGESIIQEFHNTSSFKYTKAVINESLRLSILAPWGARVNYSEDTIIDNKYIIPKAMPIFIPFGRTLEDNRLWNDSEKFYPERFQDNSSIQYQFQYQPFGFAGGRVCPGRSLSYLELLILISSLVKKFDIKMDSKKEVKKKFGLVTSPEEDIDVIIEKRM